MAIMMVRARAKLERDIGHSCINGVFLDELDPNRGRMSDEIMQDCGIMCYLAFNESERNDENDKERIDSKSQKQAV